MSAPARTRRPAKLSDADALDAWITAARYALELGYGVSSDQLRALAAQPENSGRLRAGDTSYMEEWGRLRQQYDRDAHPANLSAREVDWWRMMRESRAARMDDCARRHVQCLALAHAFLRRTNLKKEDPLSTAFRPRGDPPPRSRRQSATHRNVEAALRLVP